MFDRVLSSNKQKSSDKSSTSEKEKNTFKKPFKKLTKVQVGGDKESKAFKKKKRT